MFAGTLTRDVFRQRCRPGISGGSGNGVNMIDREQAIQLVTAWLADHPTDGGNQGPLELSFAGTRNDGSQLRVDLLLLFKTVSGNRGALLLYSTALQPP